MTTETMVNLTPVVAPVVEELPQGDGTRPEPVSDLVQSGQLILGPGARKDPNSALGALPKLSQDQQVRFNNILA